MPTTLLDDLFARADHAADNTAANCARDRLFIGFDTGAGTGEAAIANVAVTGVVPANVVLTMTVNPNVTAGTDITVTMADAIAPSSILFTVSVTGDTNGPQVSVR